MSKEKIKLLNLTQNAIVAALYVAISLMLVPLTFGIIQFRFAEILTLLPFINPTLSIGVVVGCLITNCFSEFGIIDVVFGTLGTLLTVIFVVKSKKLYIAAIWPTIFAIIPAMIISYATNDKLLVVMASVLASEFVITYVIGVPFYTIVMNNRYVMKIMKNIS